MSDAERNGEKPFRQGIVDEIGPWSEIKLEILKKYGKAYSTILSRFKLKHVYIDAFAGSGVHISRTTGEFVLGSPLNALLLKPRFLHYYFIDLDGDKTRLLREAVGEREDVTIKMGDCNEVLLKEVFPNVKYKDFRRGLCFLDPYGLHLDWQVISTAGRMRSIEILLNFPLMDMNRNVLWRNPTDVDPSNLKRQNSFWGDDSWRTCVYDDKGNLFGHFEKVPNANEVIVQKYRERLKQIAGFPYVTQPLPMKGKSGAILYYLLLATYNKTGYRIADDVFAKYRRKRTF